jgi:predicted negative regulator of RcsB-dependent stress response
VETNTSEREQLDEIKKWWDANGKSIVGGLVLGLGALFGYRYWQDVQNANAESASINYQHFLSMVQAGPSEEARTTGQIIIDSNKNSVYARLTALLLARLAIEDKKLDEAKRQLNWVLTSNPGSELATIARGRLAQVLLAEGNAAAALIELDKINKAGERDLFAETRGDVLTALGKTTEAYAIYSAAITDFTALGGDPRLLELKRDSLGIADEAVSAN